MQAPERSLIVLKPDALERGLAPVVSACLAQRGLAITRRKRFRMTLEIMKDFYQWETLDHSDALQEYLCTLPLEAWWIVGPKALLATNSIKREIRLTYARDRLHTLLHTPDSEDDLQRESLLLDSLEEELP